VVEGEGKERTGEEEVEAIYITGRQGESGSRARRRTDTLSKRAGVLTDAIPAVTNYVDNNNNNNSECSTE
jgi:hypothetical protein